MHITLKQSLKMDGILLIDNREIRHFHTRNRQYFSYKMLIKTFTYNWTVDGICHNAYLRIKCVNLSHQFANVMSQSRLLAKPQIWHFDY